MAALSSSVASVAPVSGSLKSEFTGFAVNGLTALVLKRSSHSLRVEASSAKKIQTKAPLGPSGDTRFRGGLDASGRKAKGKGVYQPRSQMLGLNGGGCRLIIRTPGQVNCCFTGDGSSSGAAEEGDASILETQTPFPRRIAQFQDVFWRFLRPHTIRGTIIGTTAVVVRALIDNSHLIDWGLLPKALRGLLALLCGNGYIVGINQIYDIGIDKVNKPFLPIASGDLSVPAAWALVITLAAVGITIVAINFGPLITGLYSCGLFLGAIYSVPPLRLKRFAVAAFLIIATVRGFLLNFGVYYATRASLGLSFTWSPPIVFITFFVTLFATVIAITKDLPDVEGDHKFQISTFATKLGVRNIAFLGSGLLLVNYFGAIIAAYLFPLAFRRGFMVVGHAVLASSLIYQIWLLDASNYSKEGIAAYYRFIWNLFYAEYALFPLI